MGARAIVAWRKRAQAIRRKALGVSTDLGGFSLTTVTRDTCYRHITPCNDKIQAYLHEIQKKGG